MVNSTVIHCHSLQLTTIQCNTLQLNNCAHSCAGGYKEGHFQTFRNSLQYTATYCNTMQLTTTHYNSIIWSKEPPPPGGVSFLFTMFRHQEPCVRGPLSRNLVQILQGGSSKIGNPPGGEVSFDQIVYTVVRDCIVEDNVKSTATHHQHIATHCNTLQFTAPQETVVQDCLVEENVKPTATHCNSLELTGTHWNSLHHKNCVHSCAGV